VLDPDSCGVRIQSGDKEIDLTNDLVYEAEDGDCPCYVWDDGRMRYVENDRQEINENADVSRSNAYKVYALPILKFERFGEVIHGLLLKAVDGGQGTYRRVGSFTSEKFDNALQMQGPHSPDAYIDVVKDDSGTTGYVIDLV
jgi:hypothetical protein